jgi:CheY-like chemotaxis protein
MVKKVLIVDDDTAMVQTLKEGLIRYDDTFVVLTAEDGLDAVERLKEHTVSIVVTDLKMPRMDGFSLLAHIMEHYPEIPVIIITGFSTPAMERAAWEGGAVGYIAKPFMINDLAKKIITTLRREADGGTLHSISSGMFLQLVEMEEKTCTIRLISKSSGRQGILFFSRGELLDARVNGMRGEEAAYEIFSWEEVSLSIQNSCQQKEKHIHRDLQAILLEAVRLKDERRSARKARGGSGTQGEKAAGHDKALSAEGVKRILAARFPEGAGVEDIYQDEAWKGLVLEVKRLAGRLKAGDFKAGYVDRGEAHDFILVPGEKVTVVSVNPKCPRDRLVETLSELS